MSWKGCIFSLGLCVVAAGWIGCETPTVVKPVVCSADQIHPGDTLSISLLGIPDQVIDRKFDVRSDGRINLPLLDPIMAAGKDFTTLEHEIKTNYVPRYYQRMTVSVKPDVRFFTVSGEVRHPAREPYVGEITVLRAIAAGGDFTEFANRRKVEIIRATGDREIVDCKRARENPRKYDRTICPGDHIIVPRSF